MAPHSSTLAWKIPWTEEPGGLQSMGSRRVRHDWSDLAAAAVACSYITLYKTIFIHLYLCISIRITLTVNRYGNIKTGWPNRTSNPVTVKVWHGKGFFFFFKLTKSLIFLSFFFFLTQHLGQPGNNHHSLPPPSHPMLPHIPVQLSSENIFQACEVHFIPTKDSKISADFEFFLVSIP